MVHNISLVCEIYIEKLMSNHSQFTGCHSPEEGNLSCTCIRNYTILCGPFLHVIERPVQVSWLCNSAAIYQVVGEVLRRKSLCCRLAALEQEL